METLEFDAEQARTVKMTAANGNMEISSSGLLVR